MLASRRAQRIGLLGGSFNPAHMGHLHISREALRRLDLDAVWWLVSPQNPLKPVRGMAPLERRIASAEAMAQQERRIRVTDIEARLGTRYTADTLKALRLRFPRTRFVWLMGADNLRQIPDWQRWTEIFAAVPVVAFARPTYSLGALAGLAAQRFRRARPGSRGTRNLAGLTAPAWAFFRIRLEKLSGTLIRARARRSLFLTARPTRGPLADTDTIMGATTIITSLRTPATLPAPDPALVPLITATLDDGKAEEIVTIDLDGKSNIADHLVIASGRSSRQVSALADQVAAALRKHGHGRVSIEGQEHGDWVLLDAGDVIVHLFRPEVRAYYNLEKMWGSAPSARREAGSA